MWSIIHDKIGRAIEYIQLGVTGKKYDPSWIRPLCLSNDERKEDYMRGIQVLHEVLDLIEVLELIEGDENR